MFRKPGRKAGMMGWGALVETIVSDDGVIASCRMEILVIVICTDKKEKMIENGRIMGDYS